MGDVLVGVAAGRRKAVGLFHPDPLPAIVVRRAEHQPSPGARTRHSSSIIDGIIGTCSMTCEHSTQGNVASANGSAKPDARTSGTSNRRANLSLFGRMSSATLPGASAAMMWLEPTPHVEDRLPGRRSAR